MSSPTATDEPSSAALAVGGQNDPFETATSPGPTHHRFSNFDSHIFAFGPNASPGQAKRALEAHLAETDRRMEEAGKLGTALVQQRKELTERLKDVDKLESEGELSEDMRQKLMEIEKEYNDVAKESARAFLPKQRVPSNEAAPASPFGLEGKGGRRSVSPSKFETQATASPTKFNVPNRKVRNQPANRIHDIEFAAEISTSLIAQVRNLQGLLSEKEDELKEVKAERSKLEYDAEGFQQRLKALDESEHRYKDENWNLETQLHDLMAKERDAADREKKLTQTFNILQAEKNSTQRELDEVKLSHSKLTEDHAAAVKHHDIELGTAKRTMVMADSERSAMQRKIEDLTGQNQELAKAVSVSQRGRVLERGSILGGSDEDFETANDKSTPEESPPPSPVKGTPRHSMLESETLKTSLGHAQRTIQGLRNNVHREKTEKLELRRMLQDARDEVEKMRSDPMPPSKPISKRTRKPDSKDFKKPPRLLGSVRPVRSEIFAEDPDDANWEDHPEPHHQPHSSIGSQVSSNMGTGAEQTDHFETAHETSDAAFETANERGTETDDFHTGAEDFSSDDVETETESPSKRSTIRGKRASVSGLRRGSLSGLTRSGSIHSLQSTASTEDEDYPFDERLRTPTSQLPPLQNRFPLRVSRGAFRRSRQASEVPSLQSSPSIVSSSGAGTPHKPVQSLAAELGDFDASDNESNFSGTPSRRSIRGRTASPPPAVPPLPRNIMVDSGMMTEPLPAISSAMLTSVVGQDMEGNVAKFPSPPTSPPKQDFALPPELALSTVHNHAVEPLPEPDTHAVELATLRAEHAEQLKNISAQNTAAQAAALEALRSQHADQLTQSQAEAKLAHVQELEALRSSHAEASSKAAAKAQGAHAQEIEALKSSHAEQTNKTTAEIQAMHAREMEALRSSHAEQTSKTAAEVLAIHAQELDNMRSAHSEQLAEKESESKAAYAAELDALKAAHAEQMARGESEHKAAYTAELEAMKAKHDAEVSGSKKDSDAAHAAELDALKAVHAEQMARGESEHKAAYTAELEAMKAKHDAEVSGSKKDSDAAHAAELDALKAAHAEQMARGESEHKATYTAELEAMKAKYDAEVSSSKKDSDAAHAAELDALKAAHAEQMARGESQHKAVFAAELEALKAKHDDEISGLKRDSNVAHAAEIAALAAAHASQVDHSKKELAENHARELDNLKADHASYIDRAKQQSDAAHAEELEELKASHLQQIDEAKKSITTAHSQQLESLKATHAKQVEDLKKDNDAARAAEVAVLIASHNKQLESSKAESDATLSSELAALKDAHAQEIDSLNSQHAATHAQELESFKAALDKQIESSKTEGDATHTQQVEALNAAHAEILDAHKRESEKSQAQALESLKSTHERQIDGLKSENASARSKELEDLAATHEKDLATLRAENESSRVKLLEELANSHSQELEDLRQENESSRAKELAALGAVHAKSLDALKDEHEAALARKTQELSAFHSQELEKLRQESEAAKSTELAALSASHMKDLDSLRNDHESVLAQTSQSLVAAHSQELESLRTESEAMRAKDAAELGANHEKDLENLKHEFEAARLRELEQLESTHAAALASLRTDHQTKLNDALEHLATDHAKSLDDLKKERDLTQAEALDALAADHARALAGLKKETDLSQAEALDALAADHAKTLAGLKKESDLNQEEAINALRLSHSKQLEQIKSKSDAALARQLETLNADHARALDFHKQESSTERDNLLASHASELEALRKSLAVARPALGLSSMSSIETTPVEILEPRSPRREAFTISGEERQPQTPQSAAIGVFGKKGKGTAAPVIAEDDTRQSPSAVLGPETPESQRPFKEMSTNTDARPRKQMIDVSDQSSQTALTSDSLDRLMKNQGNNSQDSAMMATTPFDDAPSSSTTVRVRRSSQESLGSMARARQRVGETGPVSAPEPVPARRPGSSASGHSAMQNLPPLPANHRETIEAARASSSHGGKGTMGPPLLPASAYRNSPSRPHTPSSKPPLSPTVRGTTASRAGRTSAHADLHSPTRLPPRSRQSSVSSFASEIDNRFNIRGDMAMDAAGFGPNTDPRMIQAITQTMIGEYLWKYTRKAGRGEMSENRHRRYFWVHPYTRTLYWSDRDPSTAGRAELRAKSVPIEAVRVVTDDNIMPPGLHRKSLIIVSPGRSVKFTCTTGQRHETWFNALSYLLLRTGNETQTDAEEVAGNITQEDVDEFNPSFSQRPVNGNRARAPPSLSSYNSRTTRNESPNVDMMSIPTLTATSEKDASRSGTLGRLSGYFKSSSIGGTFNSMRSRSHTPYDSAIYEASEVHDSAEDLRQMIEQQDRESDRLENVRACCDGKHDVGTLSRTTKRGRLSNLHSHSHSHSHSHTHPGQSTTPTPTGTLRPHA